MPMRVAPPGMRGLGQQLGDCQAADDQCVRRLHASAGSSVREGVAGVRLLAITVRVPVVAGSLPPGWSVTRSCLAPWVSIVATPVAAISGSARFVAKYFPARRERIARSRGLGIDDDHERRDAMRGKWRRPRRRRSCLQFLLHVAAYRAPSRS